MSKGAFTGAVEERKGVFLSADGGTLFLDEVADMSLATQVRILRSLESRKVIPVGGDQEISTDVRIIAATNKDLAEEVRQGRFREDLFYRLNVIHYTCHHFEREKMIFRCWRDTSCVVTPRR